LIVINEINRRGSRQLSSEDGQLPYYVDVDGDGYLTPLDALIVINWLNSNPVPTAGSGFDVGSASDDGEGEASSSEEAVGFHDKLGPFAVAMWFADQDERLKRRQRAIR